VRLHSCLRRGVVAVRAGRFTAVMLHSRSREAPSGASSLPPTRRHRREAPLVLVRGTDGSVMAVRTGRFTATLLHSCPREAPSGASWLADVAALSHDAPLAGSPSEVMVAAVVDQVWRGVVQPSTSSWWPAAAMATGRPPPAGTTGGRHQRVRQVESAFDLVAVGGPGANADGRARRQPVPPVDLSRPRWTSVSTIESVTDG
jgi:hypothetical protein